MSLATLADFKQYVADVQASSAYAAWARDNHGPKNDANYSVTNPKPGSELAKWYAVRDGIVSGGSPELPTMDTHFGKSLIDAAREHLDAEEPVTVTNSLKAGSTVSGTAYAWTVTTKGGCAAVEFWADKTKLGVVVGTTPYNFKLDSTKLTDGDHLFGVVEVDHSGGRHPDQDRRTARVANAKPKVTISGNPVVGQKLTAVIA